MQDEIAEDMIRMAQSLKNNSLVAKEIILSDNKVHDMRTQCMHGQISYITNDMDITCKTTSLYWL